MNPVKKYSDLLPGMPLVESPFFHHFKLSKWQGERLRIANDLHEKGFSVISRENQALFPAIDDLIRDLHPRYNWDAWHDNKSEDLRIQDAWKFHPRVREIACHPPIIDLLSDLYGRRAFPFQTLNFPVGTQQASHSDHVHFNSVPERFMCGVWIAFEDIDAENGPLFYYPGSHKWPVLTNEMISFSGQENINIYSQYPRFVEVWDEIARASGVQRQTFHAKKGDMLIWVSNLVHGGSKMLNKQRTRWSQVTHYFFEDCAYTTPVANDVYAGEVYFREIINIESGKTMQNVVSGQKISEDKIAMLRPSFLTRQMLPPDFNAETYLELNDDVRRAGVDAIEHYINFGKKEGRRFR